MSTYRVVLTGRLLPGHELDQVRQRISKAFNLDEDSEHMRRMLGGNPLTVKAGVGHEQAQAYQKVLVEAGLECNVVAENQTQTTTAVDEMSETIVEGDETDVVDPRKLSAASGWGWIKEGFYYFKLKPVVWIGMIIVFFALFMVLSLVPFFSRAFLSLVKNLLLPVFTGGLMLACHKQYQGEDIGVGDLFGGFRDNAKELLMVGAMYSLAVILLAVVIVAVMYMLGGAGEMAQLTQSAKALSSPPPELLLMALVFLALLIPILMAYYFAPALVVLHDMMALEAMKLSFKGCLRNFVPFLVYGVAALVLVIVAVIPFGLGMLVMVPVLFIANFASYRQIYTSTPSPLRRDAVQ